MTVPDRQDRTILVTFSGIDGAGKSTQIRLLQSYLTARGLRTRYLWSRGGYTSGFEKIKSYLRRRIPDAMPPSGNNPIRERQFKHRWVQMMWLSLAILDLMRVYGFQIRWWLRQDDVVICDRYIWDTAIDFQLNFPKISIERWWLWRILVWLTPQPDYSFLLVISTSESEKRALSKNDPFPDSWNRRQKRHDLYMDLAEQERFSHTIDAFRPVEDQQQSILRQIQLKLSVKIR